MNSFKNTIWEFLYITAPFAYKRLMGRTLGLTQPSFLIIGTQRGGTTALFKYLQHHPNIHLPIIKEVHYFDLQSHQSDNWYFAHFPLHLKSKAMITGEASPYYLFHPDVPRRVATLLPDIRLIILLRDPVTRAYSHYLHNRKYQLETRDFEEAITTEMIRLESGNPITLDTPLSHRHHTYIARGIYIDQLNRWLDFFPQAQLLCLPSTSLFQTPHNTIKNIIKFLSLDADELPQVPFLKYNETQLEGQSATITDSIKTKIANFYLPYNKKLAIKFNLDLEDWTGYEE